ncbi:MAG: glycoside hydrolase [Actinomycetota bacterium]|nr:glycoside hydrolase [Actinomycetota bacterium]
MSGGDGYYDTHLREPLVEENTFRGMAPEDAPPPTFEEAWRVLPQPFWEGHENVVACYRRVWELAFANVRRPEPGSGFVANFVDTAFNDCLFMWDSAFILLFARHGRRAFDFQRTLDNLYARQHPDGFICREIGTLDGRDRFERFDATSTGPNIMPWTEWEHYRDTAEHGRLSRVFPVLVAYHRWLRRHRTWRDGTYWTSGLGSGMDNQQRFPERPAGEGGWPERITYHGHLSWIDACLQQLLSADLLLRMADVLDRSEEVADLREEHGLLSRAVNERLWNEETAFYHDELPDGALSGVKTVGSYWALLADAVPPERVAPFVGHLEDPALFKRPHRVPSLSADHPQYREDGGYWLGGVWPPTNYMVLRGLDQAGYHELAHEISREDLDHVVRVFEDTGTVWENYAPERPAPGQPARPDFVGWAGLAPVAGFIEYVLGLRADAPNGRLLWDVRLLEGHGVRRYPFGREGVLDLSCEPRTSTGEEPRVRASSSVPLEIAIRWEGGERLLRLSGGETPSDRFPPGA